jgi:hypothetical protein
MATGNSSTVAVIGASGSGKTCFTTGLIRQIGEQLAQRATYRMALQWDDQDGLDYFRAQEKTLFTDRTLPEMTQKQTRIKTLQITVRFPIRHWWNRLFKGEQGVVSLIFPDPSGELLQNLNEAYFVNYLGHADAILLMVDPFAAQRYREERAKAGVDTTPYETLHSADIPLTAVIQAVRSESKQTRKKLRKQLAVVLTKCDEEGVIDLDHEHDIGRNGRKIPYPLQGRNYSPALARRISDRVAQFMETKLGLAKVVALAEQNFEDVCFFSATALGSPPIRETDDDGNARVTLARPQPRRVEEPLLWVLHKWGYF